jgi:hypothetical protein
MAGYISFLNLLLFANVVGNAPRRKLRKLGKRRAAGNCGTTAGIRRDHRVRVPIEPQGRLRFSSDDRDRVTRVLVMPRPNRSCPLPRPLIIPCIMNLKALADVRTLIRHLPKETREKSTWQLAEAKLKAAAFGGDAVELFVTLRMVPDMEGVECRPIRNRPVRLSSDGFQLAHASGPHL